MSAEPLPVVAVPTLRAHADDLGAWLATACALAANDNAPASARLASLNRLSRAGA